MWKRAVERGLWMSWIIWSKHLGELGLGVGLPRTGKWLLRLVYRFCAGDALLSLDVSAICRQVKKVHCGVF